MTFSYHLEDGQIFFPPQVFLHFWSHGGEHIVGVHNNVNECI
jgi:hypothetical protein